MQQSSIKLLTRFLFSNLKLHSLKFVNTCIYAPPPSWVEVKYTFRRDYLFIKKTSPFVFSNCFALSESTMSGELSRISLSRANLSVRRHSVSNPRQGDRAGGEDSSPYSFPLLPFFCFFFSLFSLLFFRPSRMPPSFFSE